MARGCSQELKGNKGHSISVAAWANEYTSCAPSEPEITISVAAIALKADTGRRNRGTYTIKSLGGASFASVVCVGEQIETPLYGKICLMPFFGGHELVAFFRQSSYVAS